MSNKSLNRPLTETQMKSLPGGYHCTRRYLGDNASGEPVFAPTRSTRRDIMHSRSKTHGYQIQYVQSIQRGNHIKQIAHIVIPKLPH